MIKSIKSNLDFSFSITEINLLTEALMMRASRHESMSRTRPRNAAQHDHTALAMRKLYARLRDEIWEEK